MLLPFSFEAGDVDVGRAFRFAGFAGEAEVHDALHLLVVPCVHALAGFGEHLTQHVRARARGVLFVARRHVTGTHGTAHEVRFAAFADAVAFLGGAKDALSGVKVEECFIFRRRVVGPVAQRRIHRRGINNFPGIEHAVGIEGFFDAPHHRVTFRPDHEGDELATEAAIAVFAREGAAIFLNQGGDISRNAPEKAHAFRGLEVKERASMELTGAGMSIVNAADAVFIPHQRIELGDVGG